MTTVRQPIAETTLVGLRPTGTAGRRVLDCWEQIDSYLRRSPNAELASLFAEPVVQPGGTIVWFAPDGSFKLYSELSGPEQEALRGRLSERLGQLDEETKRLRASPDAAAVLIAETLERAQQVPGAVENALFSVNNSPVLINWSLEADDASSTNEPLKEFVARFANKSPVLTPLPATPDAPPDLALTPPPAPSPAPLVPPAVAAISSGSVAVRRTIPWWWLLWLLFILLLLANLYVLLECGAGIDPQGRFCPEPRESRRARLVDEIDGLNQQLLTAPRCVDQKSAQVVPAATQAACSTQQAEGSDSPETRTIELGQAAGTFNFVYDTMTNPDRMVVSYEGQTLFDTGCTSTCLPDPPDCMSNPPCQPCDKQDELKSKTLSYSGKSTKVTVQVLPNCTGLRGTKWAFELSCPEK